MCLLFSSFRNSIIILLLRYLTSHASLNFSAVFLSSLSCFYRMFRMETGSAHHAVVKFVAKTN